MTETTARRRVGRRRPRRPRDPEGRMALGDHLRELRSRVVKSALAVVLAGVVGWIWYEPIIDLLSHPLDVARSTRGGTGLVTLNFAGIADPFTLKLKISFFVGLLIASPVWIYQLWSFITPGLHRNERRYALGFLGAAVPFFLLGSWLAFTVMPKAIEFLISLTPTDGSNVVDASFYFTFVTRFILAFGLAFLLPVAMVGVNMVGLVSAHRMMRAWRITVLAIFVFAAAATPTPDAGTMLLLGGSIVFLYALALGVCFLNDRRKARRAGAAESASWSDDEASPIEPVVRDPADDRPSPLD